MAGRNDNPGTSPVDEGELRDLKVDELRERAKDAGVAATSKMRKDDLVKAVAKAEGEGDGEAEGEGDGKAGGRASRRDDAKRDDANRDDAGGRGGPGDAGPDGGRARRGAETSKSLKYSQEITSPGDDPERAGRSLVTTSHEVIRQWAEARGGRPATVAGTEHGDHLGVLRFAFDGGDRDEARSRSGDEDRQGSRLRTVDWDEWFATFDQRGLNFIYQEERSDGSQSNFFRLENPEREDA
jgi:hypothetical protein